MSFFTIDNIIRAAGGTWMQRPDEAAMRPTIQGVGIDTRENLKDRVFVAIRGENHDGHAYLKDAAKAGALLLIVEKKPSQRNMPKAVGIVLVEDTRKALGQIALAYRRSFTPGGIPKVIAITGSSGKTTTKRLLHSVLSQAMTGTAAPKSFNNEIGVPMTLLAAQPRDQYIVLEVGTNAPGEIHRLGQIAEPDIAMITNIGRSHLEQLGSRDGVAKEKTALLSHLRDGGVAILNADEPLLRPYVGMASTTVLFGEAEHGDLRMTGFGRDEQGWWFEVNERSRFALQLPGKHNAMNALAVVAAARRFGLDDAAIQGGFDSVEPEAMRAEWKRVGEIDLFNDAYNANPDSVVAALETFAELAADSPRRVIVLGDMLELGKDGPALHREIAKRVIDLDEQCRIDHVVLIGELAGLMAQPLSESLGDDRITQHPPLTAQVVKSVIALLQPSDAVLVKGSRGMELERITERISTEAPQPTAALGGE